MIKHLKNKFPILVLALALTTGIIAGAAYPVCEDIYYEINSEGQGRWCYLLHEDEDGYCVYFCDPWEN